MEKAWIDWLTNSRPGELPVTDADLWEELEDDPTLIRKLMLIEEMLNPTMQLRKS